MTTSITSSPPPDDAPPSYSCPLSVRRDPTDFSRLNALIRTSSTAKVPLSRTESIAASLRSALGRSKGGAGGGGGGGELEETIGLRTILAGKTLSPVATEDLRGWLAWKSRGGGGKSVSEAVGVSSSSREEEGRSRWGTENEVALDFLIGFERYRSTFFALDLEEQQLAPTPFQIVSLAALAAQHQSNSSQSCTTMPSLPPVKPQTSYRQRSPSTSSSTSRPRTPESSSSLFTPSPSLTSKQQQPLYLLPPTASRSRSESDPPPLALAAAGVMPLRVLPSAAFDAMSSSSGASILFGASRRTAGGLRGMGRRPLTQADELSEEEDCDEEEPASRSGVGHFWGKDSSPSGRLRSASGGSSQTTSSSSTLRTVKPNTSVKSTLSRRRASTLPSSPPQPPPVTLFADPLSDITRYETSLAPSSPSFSPSPASFLTCPPDEQPLRAELAALLARAERLPREFRPTAQVKSEAEMTTHPDVLSALAGRVEEWAEREWLMGKGGFLADALENLDHRTALGRLLCGSFLSFVAIIAFFLLLLDPSPFRADGKALSRPWRLIVVPMFLGGIGYAMGSRKSLCFWLALFGVREPRSYESAPISLATYPPTSQTTATSRSRSNSSSIRHKHRQPSLSSVFEEETSSTTDFGGGGVPMYHPPTFSTTHSRAGSQASLLPRTKPHSSSSAIKRLFHRIRLRLPSPPRPKVPTIKINWSPTFILLWRLTGTAWGTRRVEDPRVLRAQRRGAWKIAGVLMLGVGVGTGVVMGVPGIRVGR